VMSSKLELVMGLLDVVHVLHGVISLRLLGEAHKAESTAAACIAVLDNDLTRVSYVLERTGDVGDCRSRVWKS
jgi:hypothetical protein